MESNSATECNLCNEEYHEEHRTPRSLPCSHCICSDCVYQLIARNMKECPFCRQGFQAKSTRDIGINTGLLEVLKLLRDKEEKSADLKTSPHWRDEFIRENKEIANKNIGLCRDAQGDIDKDMKTNNEILKSILAGNKIIENKIMVKIKDIVERNVQKVAYLQEQNKRLETQKREMKENQRQSEEAIGKLADTADRTKHTALTFHEVEEAISGVNTCLREFDKLSSGEREARNTIKVATNNMKDKVLMLRNVLNSMP